MTDEHSYPLRVLEDDQTVPPRPEEDAAEIRREANDVGDGEHDAPS